MINILNIINKWVKKKAKYSPHTFRTYNEQIFLDKMAEIGEALYVVNLKAGGSLLSRIIGFFSSGYSHSVLMVYTNDITQYVNAKELVALERAWTLYYGGAVPLVNEQTKTYVLGSAEQRGMLVFDFGKYNNRTKQICLVTKNKEQIKRIIKYVCSKLTVPYDTTGLVLYLLKLGDDPDAYFCSEICYDACAAGGIIIADRNNPSPGDIARYMEAYNIINI